MRHTQLDLFAGSHELCQLRTENESLTARLDAVTIACGELQAEIKWLKNKIRSWKRSYKRLKDERNAIYAARLDEAEHPLRQECQQLRHEGEGLRDMLRQHLERSWALGSGGLNKEALTKLLVLCHPDRWAQGQMATELAHELSVTLNEWRSRWGVV